MGAALGIVYRVIAAHLARKAGFKAKRARTGAVTLIQRFGGALNLNLHFHMLVPRWVFTSYGGEPIIHPSGSPHEPAEVRR